jgi:tetratricopeptide (TPR) repeat protein
MDPVARPRSSRRSRHAADPSAAREQARTFRRGAVPGPVVAALAPLLLAAGCFLQPTLAVLPTPPEDANVAIDGAQVPGNRKVVKPNSEHTVLVTWSDGTRIERRITMQKNETLVIRKDSPDATQGEPVAPAAGADDGAAPTGQAATGDQLAQARALFDEGRKAFELAEYDQAIERFQAAYLLVRDQGGADVQPVLATIQFNLAVAYEKSHAIQPDPARLRKAKDMYEKYDESMARSVSGWTGSRDQADIRAAIARVVDELAKPQP